LMREERVKRKAVSDNPGDEEILQAYRDFRKQALEFELSEFKEWAQAYPTDMAIQFEMGRRQFELGQYDDAISTFQQSRNDPKFRTDSAIYLGKAFLEHGFLDEADETLSTLVRDYPQREGTKYKDMCYWRGRVLEQKNATADAIKAYSQVFQQDSAYLDVSARIKRLRTAAPPAPPSA
jgi:tetratricopeptide (TPR) repeat protein